MENHMFWQLLLMDGGTLNPPPLTVETCCVVKQNIVRYTEFHNLNVLPVHVHVSCYRKNKKQKKQVKNKQISLQSRLRIFNSIIITLIIYRKTKINLCNAVLTVIFWWPCYRDPSNVGDFRFFFFFLIC